MIHKRIQNGWALACTTSVKKWLSSFSVADWSLVTCGHCQQRRAHK